MIEIQRFWLPGLLGMVPKMGELIGAPEIGRAQRLQSTGRGGMGRRFRLLFGLGDASSPNTKKVGYLLQFPGLSFPTTHYKSRQVEESVVLKNKI